MEKPLLLGTHVSVAGGMSKAFGRAESVGCTAMQVFVKGNTRWQFPAHSAAEIAAFNKAAEASPVMATIAHAIYLVNLASDKPEFVRKSVDDLMDELNRCDALGIGGLVMHPGAHCGQGLEDGIARVAAGMDEVFAATAPGGRCKILLETTAGQGSCFGDKLSHLRQIIDRMAPEHRSRVGACVDTCHVFSAGYAIHEAKGYKDFWREFDDTLGLDLLGALHLNDSKKPFASRLDRHEHIGKGSLGLEPFRMIMNDKKLRGVPMLLETEKGPDMEEDRVNLGVLRGLLEK